MDKSGGSREEKDHDHPGNGRKRNAGSLGFKNEEGSDKKSSDEVPQSLDQMEVVEDVTGGLGRMFGNNDLVEANSNAEFIASQMDRRGPVGLVGGQFGNELGQSSDNSDVLNQRKRPRGQNTGNIGSSSYGTALDQRNVLGQSTTETQPVLHSESLNVLGQSASGAQPVLHSESSNVFGQGQGQGTGGTRSVLHSESSSRNVYGRGQQGMHSQSQSVTPTATQYQRGRFTVTHEQPSAISGVSRPRGVHEHNMRVWSDPNIASGNNLRPRGSGTGFYMPQAVQEHNMRARSDPDIASGDMSRLRGPLPQSGTSFYMPPCVQEHNMRVWSDPNIASGNNLRPWGPFPQSGTAFYMPPGVQEHNMRVWSDLNIASGNNLRPWGPFPQSGTSFYMPPGVQEHNMRVWSDPNIASGNNLRPRGSGTGFYMPRAVQKHNMRVRSDPYIARGNMARPRGPSVQPSSDTHTFQRGRFTVTTYEQPSGNPGFIMPRGVQEHNMRIRSDANMVRANMFRQGTHQMGQQRGFFGTPMNPFFPTFASQNVGLPVTSPPVHMGMLPNANMAVEARDREEAVSDKGSTSEEP